MTPQDRDIITRLRRDIADLQERTRLIPVRWSGNTTAVDVITNSFGSDTLATVAGVSYTGVAIPGSTVTSVPTSVPGAGPFPAGLGKGTLLGASVWIGILAGGVNDSVATIPNGQTFTTRKTATVSVSGGGGLTAKVYLPWDF